MCGIAGFLCLSPEQEIPSESSWARALGRLDHRGPDGHSSYISPDRACVLGHTRLKVIDLVSGDQPMSNEDESVWVVFNGEIYNFQELRGELEGLGHRFRTRSDTETIVQGYLAWGDDVVRRLDGMFAFALWDVRRRRLLMGRDRAGKKPFFIYRDERRLAFASELKALSALDGLDLEVDAKAFPLYLTYGYVPTPGTFYRKVQKLPPGCYASVDRDKPGELSQQRYWQLDFTPRSPIPADEACSQLRTLLKDAVRRRLVADVPIGAFLSGGIDSSILVGLMSGLVSEPVRTFSIGFEDDKRYDETHFARIVSQHFGTRHTEFTVGSGEISLLEDLLEAYDEPFGDSSAIPTYIVSRLTREHVTVALTGDGGDELFAGYPRFQGAAVVGAIPGWLIRWANALVSRLPHAHDPRSLSRRLQRFLEAASLPEAERTLRWIGYCNEGQLGCLLRPELVEMLPRQELLRSFQEPIERTGHLSPQARSLALNFDTYLLDDLLVKADRCSMAHALELRSPFLDTAVMEFAASLPDHLRIRRGRLKWILRAAYADLLPPAILRRGKMGFGIPLPTWFRQHWRGLVEDVLLHPEAAIWRWLERKPAVVLVQEHVSGRADHSFLLWSLLTLQVWLSKAGVPPSRSQ